MFNLIHGRNVWVPLPKDQQSALENDPCKNGPKLSKNNVATDATDGPSVNLLGINDTIDGILENIMKFIYKCF